jgi:hypothetical protein
VSFVALNRRFFEWHERAPVDPSLRVRYGSSYGSLGWDDLLAKRRVVVLAEAGSGKTAEMAEQVRMLQQAGRIAFFGTVEDVGVDGLDGALTANDRAYLEAWRQSNDKAWFFIDSVDEAKLNKVSIDRALRRLSDGLAGAQRRAHVVLSSRHTDWEFERDLKRFKSLIPILDDQVAPLSQTPDESLISTIHHKRSRAILTAADEPTVALMAPLDRQRVQFFAAAKNVARLNEFMAQIDAADLWRFAQRPLDLDWLVEFWKRHNRLGNLAEMVESSVMARLQETNLERALQDGLDANRALQALERIGAALVLGRKSTIAVPDSELTLSDDDRALKLEEVLPDWSASDRIRLLGRPVFDPATFGQARLHNDNEGAVSGYLTGRWLKRLRTENLGRDTLFGLLFANTHGIDVIKPSMRETTAWLVSSNEDVAFEVARRDPALLLDAGDPASLPAELRGTALTRLVEQISSDGPEFAGLDLDSLKRFSQPDIANVIRTLWVKYRGHAEVRLLLLRLALLGELKGCADLAEEAAFGAYVDRDTRVLSGRAVAVIGSDATKLRYVDYIKCECASLPNALAWNAVYELFPEVLKVDDLLAIIGTVDITDNDGAVAFGWQSPDLVNRLNSRVELQKLLSGLLEQLGDEAGNTGYPPNNREEAYFTAINSATCRLLECCPESEAPEMAIDAVLQLRRVRNYVRPVGSAKDASVELHRSAPRRRVAF